MLWSPRFDIDHVTVLPRQPPDPLSGGVEDVLAPPKRDPPPLPFGQGAEPGERFESAVTLLGILNATEPINAALGGEEMMMGRRHWIVVPSGTILRE